MNLFQTSQTLSPEFQRLFHGKTAAQPTAAEPAAQPETAAAEQPAEQSAEPQTAAPAEASAAASSVQTAPASAAEEKNTLPDLPFTRAELDELLGEVSQLMFERNKKAIEEQRIKPKKRRLSNLRVAKRPGVIGLRLYPKADDFKTEIFGKDLIEFNVQNGFWGRLYERHPDQRDVRIRGQYDSAEEARFFGTRDYIVIALNSWLRDKRLATVQVSWKKGGSPVFCRTDAEEAFFCWLTALLLFYRHEQSIARIPLVQDCFDSAVLAKFYHTEDRARLCCFFALLHVGCMMQANVLMAPENEKMLDSGKAETAKRYLEELALKDTLEIELLEKILKNALKRNDYGIIREEMLKKLLD
jgi:hypothetical protein